MAQPKHLTPHRELQLLDAHRAGDQDATAQLLESYQRRIYSICYRMLHDAEAAFDLTQDTMVRVLEGLDSYNGKSKLSTWIIRVAMNCCLSHLRREKLRSHQSLDVAGDTGTDMEGTSLAGRIPDDSREPDAGERVELSEEQALMKRALQAIDPQMRSILVLRDIQGLEYQQIGEVVDVPVGTVKSRLFRARAALREAVETEQQRKSPGASHPGFRSDAIGRGQTG